MSEIETKNLHVHLHVLHAHKVVAQLIDLSCGVCKKKIDAKSKTFHMIIFVFLHIPQNVSVFGETLQTRLDCEYINAKLLVDFYLTIQNNFFWLEGHTHPERN
jgi:hypothetical protein